MTEGPWSQRPVPPPPPASTRPANWGFFLLVSLGIGIAAGLLSVLFQQLVGFAIPDIVVNLAVLFATVSWAGNRWLKANGRVWSQADRKKLGLAYTAVNAVISFIVIGLMVVLVMNGFGAELGLPAEVLTPEMMPIMAVVLAIVVPLALLINYGLTRWILFQFVNKNARSGDDVSKEFA